MQWKCSQLVEDAFWHAAKAELNPRALVRKTLVRSVIQRSEMYTTKRESLQGSSRHSDMDLAARALFFSIADAAKISIPLGELESKSHLPGLDGGQVRILDIGAGAGAMTLGIAEFYQKHDVALTSHMVDQDKAALAIASKAASYLNQHGIPLKTTIQTGRLSSVGLQGPFDIVVMGTVLNELTPDLRKEVIKHSLNALNEKGALIAIEPALRETSRNIHQLRDWVLNEKLACVFAPCVRRCSPCPALEHVKDWCHEDRPASLPEKTQQIALATGLRDGGLKFSYLVLRKEEQERSPDLFRVVSHPKRGKGVHQMMVCNDSGRRELILQRRNRSPSNRAIERARRGDTLLGNFDVLKDGRLEASKDLSVTLDRPSLPGFNKR